MGAILASQAADAANLSVYTFAAMALGPESSNRQIAICIGSRKTGADISAPVVTVAGQSASAVVFGSVDNFGYSVGGIFIASTPSGTTGDVQVAFPATMLRAAVAVYCLTDLSTVHETDIATAAEAFQLSVNVAVNAGSTAILLSSDGGGRVGDIITGLTTDSSQNPEGNYYLNTASGNDLAAGELVATVDYETERFGKVVCMAAFDPSGDAAFGNVISQNNNLRNVRHAL